MLRHLNYNNRIISIVSLFSDILYLLNINGNVYILFATSRVENEVKNCLYLASKVGFTTLTHQPY